MWPKSKGKKGKSRKTQAKLKAIKSDEPEAQDKKKTRSTRSKQAAVSVPEGPNAAMRPVTQGDGDEASGVWKARVLDAYKENPRSSHTLLAKIPTGTAKLETSERQIQELIKESLVKVVDRMFDNFQNTAYQFNKVTAGSDLELSWIRPTLTREACKNWQEGGTIEVEVFSGRISTRYWTLIVRGSQNSIHSYVLPSDKLLGFGTNPEDFEPYLAIEGDCDGLSVSWSVAGREIPPDLYATLFRSLLDGLIRFANEEAEPGETFRLEDIGFEEAKREPQPLPEHLRAGGPELLSLESDNEPEFEPEPQFMERPESGVIADVSSKVAFESTMEVDKLRESFITQEKPQISSAGASKGDSEWKMVGGQLPPAVASEWQSYIHNTRQENIPLSDNNEGEWNQIASEAVSASLDKVAGMPPQHPRSPLQAPAPSPPMGGQNSPPFQALANQPVHQPVHQPVQPPIHQPDPGQFQSGAQQPISQGSAQFPPQLQRPGADLAEGQFQAAQYRDPQPSWSQFQGAQPLPSSAPGLQFQGPPFAEPDYAEPVHTEPQYPGYKPPASQQGASQFQAPSANASPFAQYQAMQEPAQQAPDGQWVHPLQARMPAAPQSPEFTPPWSGPAETPSEHSQYLLKEDDFNDDRNPPGNLAPPSHAQYLDEAFAENEEQTEPSSLEAPNYDRDASDLEDDEPYPEDESDEQLEPCIEPYIDQDVLDEDHGETEADDFQSEQYAHPDLSGGVDMLPEDSYFNLPPHQQAETQAQGQTQTQPGRTSHRLPPLRPSTQDRQDGAFDNLPEIEVEADVDLTDALCVLLTTLDRQVEILSRQGGEAFAMRDFKRAEVIIKLSERLTDFKADAASLLDLLDAGEQ